MRSSTVALADPGGEAEAAGDETAGVGDAPDDPPEPPPPHAAAARATAARVGTSRPPISHSYEGAAPIGSRALPAFGRSGTTRPWPRVPGIVRQAGESRGDFVRRFSFGRPLAAAA